MTAATRAAGTRGSAPRRGVAGAGAGAGGGAGRGGGAQQPAGSRAPRTLPRGRGGRREAVNTSRSRASGTCPPEDVGGEPTQAQAPHATTAAEMETASARFSYQENSPAASPSGRGDDVAEDLENFGGSRRQPGPNNRDGESGLPHPGPGGRLPASVFPPGPSASAAEGVRHDSHGARPRRRASIAMTPRAIGNESGSTAVPSSAGGEPSGTDAGSGYGGRHVDVGKTPVRRPSDARFVASPAYTGVGSPERRAADVSQLDESVTKSPRDMNERERINLLKREAFDAKRLVSVLHGVTSDQRQQIKDLMEQISVAKTNLLKEQLRVCTQCQARKSKLEKRPGHVGDGVHAKTKSKKVKRSGDNIANVVADDIARIDMEQKFNGELMRACSAALSKPCPGLCNDAVAQVTMRALQEQCAGGDEGRLVSQHLWVPEPIAVYEGSGAPVFQLEAPQEERGDGERVRTLLGWSPKHPLELARRRLFDGSMIATSACKHLPANEDPWPLYAETYIREALVTQGAVSATSEDELDEKTN